MSLTYEKMLSEKGRPLLVVRGLKFGWHKKLANNLQRWVCTQRNCRCYLKLNSQNVIVESNISHNHVIDKKKLEREKLNNSLKRKVDEDPTVYPSKLQPTGEFFQVLLTEEKDTSQHELAKSHANGLMNGITEEEEKSKKRPADIDANMHETDREKEVLKMTEIEPSPEAEKDDSGCVDLLQQKSDMLGGQGARFNSNIFKNLNCVVPINDIRGGDVTGYLPGEKQLRCKLAAVFRLLDLYGWTQGVGGQISARLNQDQEHFLVNPYGLLYHEITASSLVKVNMQGEVVDQGTTNFGIHLSEFQLHSTIHAARPDITCIIHITTPTVTAVSSLKCGLLPIGNESIVIGDVSTHHQFIGDAIEPEEREKITRNLGPINKVMLLTNRGALCCGETIEEAFYNVYNTVVACKTQLKLMPVGIDNLTLINDENKKIIYDASRKSPASIKKLKKRWHIGGTEFEALMRLLDNAGFRTGYSYRNQLIESKPSRAKNNAEIPSTVG
ncbi:hypothetical protein HCN44_002190 [Aphidius gifuensis]|uniref:Class II aldolase/adducin N-terminal domain-containing protein n=1 Tax=Aphidius gifuensis TaxID=684658 RepID=A0A834XWU1_APHGI|nr:protein hu-li tai shao-like [Aphidius gifuensis]KAF7994226.1 hypothetical protein HCN44_002190 [Aphidius gifuensis]